MASNIFLVASFVFLFSMSNLLNVGSNLWVSYWTKNRETKSENIIESTNNATQLSSNETIQSTEKFSNLFFFLVYAGIGSTQCIVALISDFMFLIVTLTASATLHRDMLFSILRSNMEFFESTPIGRIINRFR
jgi:ABC-type multidrug transport system fused ATPase/permease subunit